MAVTDDIPEKVADLLLEQTARAATTAVNTTASMVEGAGVITNDVLQKIYKDLQTRKLLGKTGEITPLEMTDLIKKLHEKSSTVRVDDRDARDYEELLKQQDLLYAKMDIKDDAAKMFVFLNRDMEKIENIATVLSARRGKVNEVQADLYFKSLAPDNVRLVDGLDPAEMELFRHYSRQEGLLYTVLPRDGKYAVLYGTEEEKKARKTLLHVGWALTSADGARIREQVEYHLEGRSMLQIEAEQAEHEFYLVNQKYPGHFIHITLDELEVYKGGKRLSTLSRGRSDFVDRCMALCESMQSAVVLQKEEFHPGMTREELQNHRTLELLPADYDEMIEMDHQNDFINLVALKSGMDDEHNATWGLWDPSVSYSEFSAYEFIMDEEERDAREREFEHFKSAAFYAKDHYLEQEIHLDEKNIDYIIAQAEEKRKRYLEAGAKYQSSKEQENEPLF